MTHQLLVRAEGATGLPRHACAERAMHLCGHVYEGVRRLRLQHVAEEGTDRHDPVSGVACALRLSEQISSAARDWARALLGEGATDLQSFAPWLQGQYAGEETCLRGPGDLQIVWEATCRPCA